MENKVMKNSNTKLGTCKRCHDEKEINKFGLCKACETEVDHEYGILYSIKDMNY